MEACRIGNAAGYGRELQAGRFFRAASGLLPVLFSDQARRDGNRRPAVCIPYRAPAEFAAETVDEYGLLKTGAVRRTDREENGERKEVCLLRSCRFCVWGQDCLSVQGDSRKRRIKR